MKITQAKSGWYSGGCLVVVDLEHEGSQYIGFVLVDRKTGQTVIPTYFRKEGGEPGEVQNNVMPADVVAQVENAARKFLLVT